MSTMILTSENNVKERINNNNIGPYPIYNDQNSIGKKSHDIRLLIYMLLNQKKKELSKMLEFPVYNEFIKIYEIIKNDLNNSGVINLNNWWCCYNVLDINTKRTHPKVFLSFLKTFNKYIKWESF